MLLSNTCRRPSEASAMTIPPNTEVYLALDDIFKTSKNAVPVGAFITKENELSYIEIALLQK